MTRCSTFLEKQGQNQKVFEYFEQGLQKLRCTWPSCKPHEWQTSASYAQLSLSSAKPNPQLQEKENMPKLQSTF
jgi:hypothetical protein